MFPLYVCATNSSLYLQWLLHIRFQLQIKKGGYMESDE
jgi:hypothetical protein